MLCQPGYLNIVGEVSLLNSRVKVLVLQLYPLQRIYNDLILRTLHYDGIIITPTKGQMPCLTSRMLNRANTEVISATEKVILQKVNVF